MLAIQVTKKKKRQGVIERLESQIWANEVFPIYFYKLSVDFSGTRITEAMANRKGQGSSPFQMKWRGSLSSLDPCYIPILCDSNS
jgi:hypothetical protein